MADIEIVKVGLKYHRDSHKEGCVQGSQACPYITKGDRCFHILLDDALSVINEQQAEIDRLKAELNQYHKADTFLAAHGWQWKKTTTERSTNPKDGDE